MDWGEVNPVHAYYNAATTTTTLPLPPQPQQGPSDPIIIKHMGELEEFIANLVEENQALETLKEVVISSVKHAMRAPLRARFKDLPTSDMKEILLQRMLEENYDKGHANHRVAYEALQDSIRRDEIEDFDVDKAQEETKKKSKQDSPNTPPGSPPSPPPPPPPPSGASGASGTTGASDSAQAPPPPPPSSSTHQGDQSTSTAAPSSSKTAASAEYSAWTTTDTRVKPSITTIPDDLYMDDETTADEQAYSSGDEVGRDHIPTVNLRQSWWKPLTEDRPATPEPAWNIPSSDLTMPTNNWASALKSTYAPPQENSLLAQTGDMAMFMDWYCKRQGITHLTLQDLEGPAFEIVKVFHPDVIHLQFQMEECHKLLTDQVDDTILRYNVSKPLPLGGEPGHVTIQPDFFFNKDLEYLRYGRKVGRPALSISKMKAAYYPDVGLEQLVPDQFWIEEECKYDIAAMYGISHWWFQRQRFYIDRFSSEGDRRAVRTHMRILSVVRIEVFSMYGYNYMKKIVLRRADLKEYVIAERDFKYMYPSDFEDLYLLNLQGHLNHLSPEDKKILTTAVNLWTRNLVIRQRVEDFQLGIESYQTQLNLTKPRWDATGFEFKHDYTVIDSPRAVTFRDRYGVQMIMRFNEIHKFSDGTLQQIDEALDYRVKEFRVNRTNPGMNTRFWTKKDVVRSKEFMFAIQKRLKTRRIFRNLESFVGGRIREGDYRSYKDGKVRYSLPRSRQNRRDLPRDNPLVSVEVLRSSYGGNGIPSCSKEVNSQAPCSDTLMCSIKDNPWTNQTTYNSASATLNSNVLIQEKCEHAGPKVTMSHEGHQRLKNQRLRATDRRSWTWPTKKELGLTSPRWSVSAATKEDTLQGSAGHPGIKTARTGSLPEGSCHLDDFVDVNESISESVVEKPTVETNEPKTARKENGALIIEDWVSESEEDDVPKVNTVKGTRVNTARPKAVLSAVKGNKGNIVKASTCWVWRPKHIVLDHVSRNNDASMPYKRLDNIEDIRANPMDALAYARKQIQSLQIMKEIDGGLFGQLEINSKEGKLIGKDTPTNSKAFRVFNSRNRIVKENLHVQFSENTPNIAGSGSNWLFDIHALTKSMNYKTIVTGNRSNGNACTKACDDASKAKMETVPGKDYILQPLWPVDLLFSQSSKSSAGFKPSGDDEKKVTKDLRKEGGDLSKDSECSDQEKEDNVNSTNTVNAANTNEVNDVGAKTSIELPDDPNMPELEDIVYSDDDEDVGAEADMNNLDAFMPVSPIPTTRIHKDHPVEQIIGDLNSAPQTRRMTKNLEEHGLFSSVQQRTNHKDFQNCLFACFLSQEEPKKVIHALKDPSWIEAMQEELL
ncbi:hypothetical protein Tco_0808177 [Tanacetum coccineum]